MRLAALAIASFLGACHETELFTFESGAGDRSAIQLLYSGDELTDAIAYDLGAERALWPIAILGDEPRSFIGFYPETLAELGLTPGRLRASVDFKKRLPRPTRLEERRIGDGWRPSGSREGELRVAWPIEIQGLGFERESDCGELVLERELTLGRICRVHVPTLGAAVRRHARGAAALDEVRVLIGLDDGRLFVADTSTVVLVGGEADCQDVIGPISALLPISEGVLVVSRDGSIDRYGRDLARTRLHQARTSIDIRIMEPDGSPEGDELVALREAEGRIELVEWRGGDWIPRADLDAPLPVGCAAKMRVTRLKSALWLEPGHVAAIVNRPRVQEFELGSLQSFSLGEDPLVVCPFAMDHRGGRAVALTGGTGVDQGARIFGRTDPGWIEIASFEAAAEDLFGMSDRALVTMRESRILEVIYRSEREPISDLCEHRLGLRWSPIALAAVGDRLVAVGHPIGDGANHGETAEARVAWYRYIR